MNKRRDQEGKNHVRHLELLLPVGLFLILAFIIFRSYFIGGLVPFPANLLVSFYQPWTSYPNPEYPNGLPNKPMGFDNLRIHYPLKTLALKLVKNGQAPLWNPHNFGGNTLLGTYQFAAFLPLNILFLILNQIDAWSWLIVLQPVLACTFFYLMLITFGLSGRASFFGAIAYGLSGFSIVWWEESYMAGYTAMGLPLVLFGLEKFIRHRTYKWFIGLSLSLTWLILAGWFQFTFYAGLVITAWIIYCFRQKLISGKTALLVVAASIIAILLSGIHLIPGAEAYLQSARGTTDAKFLFSGYLLPLVSLVTLIVPDFFGNPASYNYFGSGFYYERIMFYGLPALLLTLYAIFVKFSDRRVVFMKYLFLVTLSLGLSLPTSWLFLYYLKLPFFSVLIPSRIFYLTVFAGATLAAYGYESLERKSEQKERRYLAISAAVIGLVLAICWLYVFSLRSDINLIGQVGILRRNLVIPSVIFFLCAVIAALPRFTFRIKLTVVALILIGGQMYFAQKYLYFSDRRMVFPQTPVLEFLKSDPNPDRFWSFGEGYIEQNFSTQYGLYSVEGYDSFFVSRYGELIDASVHQGLLRNDINRADVLLAKTQRIDEVFKSPYRRRMLSLLNVKYIVSSAHKPRDVTEDLVPPKELSEIWHDGKYIVYRNNDALPRAFLTTNYEVLNERQQIVSRIFSPEFNPAKTIILENEPAVKPVAGSVTGTATIRSYQPQSVKISTQASGSALLFISDAYYPGWNAYADRVRIPVLRADYAFRAVALTPGKHEVEFKYEPVSFRIGILLTTAGIVMLFAGFIFRQKSNLFRRF